MTGVVVEVPGAAGSTAPAWRRGRPPSPLRSGSPERGWWSSRSTQPPADSLAAGLPRRPRRRRGRRGGAARAPRRVHAGAGGHRRAADAAPRPGAGVGRRARRPEHAGDEPERLPGRDAVRGAPRLVSRAAAAGRGHGAAVAGRAGGARRSARSRSRRARLDRGLAAGRRRRHRRRARRRSRPVRRCTCTSTATCSIRPTRRGSTSPHRAAGAGRGSRPRWRRSPRRTGSSA